MAGKTKAYIHSGTHDVRPPICLGNTKGYVGYVHYIHYTPVNYHSNGNSPFPIRNTSSNGGFSIAMLVYRRVPLTTGFIFSSI